MIEFISSLQTEVSKVSLGPVKSSGICGLIYMFLFFGSIPMMASQKQSPPSIASTMILKPVVVSLTRGGEADVFVEVVAPFGGESKFEISRGPKYGTLDSGRRVDSNIQRFHYKNNAANYSKQDTFEFRVKAPSHAWSSYTANIIVSDSSPTITVFPEILNFGKVPVNTTKEAVLLISNSFGAPISGRIQVRAPWSIVGENMISLSQGECVSIRILFSPSNSQLYKDICNIFPKNSYFQPVYLIGQGAEHFFLSTNSLIVSPEQSNAVLDVTNNVDIPITVSFSGDTNLDYSESLIISPAGVAKLKIASERVKLPENSSRVFHAYVDSGHFSQKIEITVNGPDKKLVINVPTVERPLVAEVGKPISIDGKIVNQSKNAHFLQFELQDESDFQKPPILACLEVMGYTDSPFSLLWNSTEQLPKILSLTICEKEKQIGSFSWHVMEKEKSKQSPLITAGPSMKKELSLDDKDSVRLATERERDSLVINSPPCFRNTLFGRKLVLRWLYFGLENNPVFKIRERIQNKNQSNYPSEEKTNWKIVGTISKRSNVAPDGRWEVVLRMPLPGIHDYIVTTDSPGEKIAAIQSVYISWSVFLWSYLKVFLLIAVIIIVVEVIRRRV